MTEVARARLYLYIYVNMPRLFMKSTLSLPCEDILGVIVAQVDSGRSAERDAAGFIVHHSHKLGLCRYVSKL